MKGQESRIRLTASAQVEDTEQYRFNITFYVFKDGDNYISYCPSLDLTSAGITYNEAVASFYECFQLYIETCLEFNTLDADLEKHGWKKKSKEIIQPAFRVLMKKPEMKSLMEGDINYEKITSTVRIPITA